MLYSNSNKDDRRQRFYLENLKKMKIGIPDLSDSGFKTPNHVLELVLAPTVFCFSLWVLQQAAKKKINKLFFLARDGYPVYVVSKYLADHYEMGIECKYFYCSRYSLRVPMYSENIEETLDHVCRGGIDVTFRKVLLRSGFTDEVIERMKSEFDDIVMDETIPYPKLQEIKTRLADSKEYLNLLIHRSKGCWENTRLYFEQEGMLLDNIGIVDSGWTGTTQKSICDIRERCGVNRSVNGFYFGLFEVPRDCDEQDYHCCYFAPKTDFLNKVFFSNCLFEVLFHANHGTTCGYRKEKGISPILEQYKESEYIDALTACLYAFTEKAVEQAGSGLLSNDSRETIKILSRSLRTFMWNPTASEADYFGRFTFSDDLLDESMREVAPVFSIQYIRENHFLNRFLTAFGIRKKHIHESAWYEASVIRSGHGSLYHRCSYSLYKALSFIKKSL